MKEFVPIRVLYEERALDYELGNRLYQRYHDMGIQCTKIDKHHDVTFVRQAPDEQFLEFKKYLVLGVRKSMRLMPNSNSADFLVPFTSSGCSAMCTYCYLVCTFFKSSYLRVFVNRDDMMNAIKRKAYKLDMPTVFELGSNSDMVLENQITGNLEWAIKEIAGINNASCTFATKFHMVDCLLQLKHNDKTTFRMSMNPRFLIKQVEIGTSKLEDRIDATNKMYLAGYHVGINIAPIILVDNYRELYEELFKTLAEKLNPRLKEEIFFELIFLTFGVANEKINSVAMKNVMNIFEREKMRGRGRGKYCYKKDYRQEAEAFFRGIINQYFPGGLIKYIV